MLLLIVFGGLLIRSSREGSGALAARFWGAGFLVAGAGSALGALAAGGAGSVFLVVADVLVAAAGGAIWAAARAQAGRRATTAVASAGIALAVGAQAFGLGAPGRSLLLAAVVASYAVAAAAELRTGCGNPRIGRAAAAVLLAHAGFILLHAASAPALGLVRWSAAATAWREGALALETMLFALCLGASAMALCRAPARRAAPRVEPAEDAWEDTLTGIGDYRALIRFGAAAIAQTADGPVTLLLLDLDGFRAVNERHGREAADRLLVTVGRVAHAYLPPTSLVCRIGGDVFAALLPAADVARARGIADDLRRLVAHLEIDVPAKPLRATVSIGIAGARAGSATVAALLHRAAGCLEAAKADGGNRVADDAGVGRRIVAGWGRAADRGAGASVAAGVEAV